MSGGTGGWSEKSLSSFIYKMSIPEKRTSKVLVRAKISKM